MRKAGYVTIATILMVSAALFFSCGDRSGGEQKETAAAEQEETVSYVSEEVSFGIFFDREGTKRTIELKSGQEELTIFVIVHIPDFLEIAAVQWRLDMPAGVELDIDRYNKNRVMSLGQMRAGISERYKPCLPGPKALIHELTLKVTGELKNATFSILPSPDGNFLGIANCSEGFPQERASSYKAVVNPE